MLQPASSRSGNICSRISEKHYLYDSVGKLVGLHAWSLNQLPMFQCLVSQNSTAHGSLRYQTACANFQSEQHGLRQLHPLAENSRVHSFRTTSQGQFFPVLVVACWKVSAGCLQQKLLAHTRSTQLMKARSQHRLNKNWLPWVERLWELGLYLWLISQLFSVLLLIHVTEKVSHTMCTCTSFGIINIIPIWNHYIKTNRKPYYINYIPLLK